MSAPTTDRRTALALIAVLPASLLSAPSSPFDEAVERYRRAKAVEQAALTEAAAAGAWTDSIVGRLDDAIDELAAAPSPDLAALRLKVEILASEYGADVQSRHFIALAKDARRLA